MPTQAGSGAYHCSKMPAAKGNTSLATGARFQKGSVTSFSILLPAGLQVFASEK
jgi:hypothetical protein